MLLNANTYKYIGYIAIILSIYLIVDYIYDDSRYQYEKFLKHKVQLNNNKSISNNIYRILVLGDYLQKNTDLQLQLLQKANCLIDYDIQYIVRWVFFYSRK